MLETGLCATATSCLAQQPHVGVVEPHAVRGDHLASSSPALAAYSIEVTPRVVREVGDLLADLVQVDVQPRGVPQQLDGRPDQLVRGGRDGGQPDPEPAPVTGPGRLPPAPRARPPRAPAAAGCCRPAPVRDVAAQAELGPAPPTTPGVDGSGPGA